MKIYTIVIISIFTISAYSNSKFPNSKWVVSSLSKEGLSPEKFAKFEKYLFDKSTGYSTDSVVIIKNGSLVYERYENGFHKEMPHRIWSCSKSFSSALIGISISKNLLKLETKLSDHYPTLQSEFGKLMTLRHLLQMSSGIDWNEGYESSPLRSDVIRMLYTKNYDDMGKYTSTKEVKFKPGTRFNYSSGETNLIMDLLKKTMSKNEYNDYPWKELFNKIGIESATWEQDQSGTFVGSSYLFMTPKDFARFGLLYLNSGKWNNKEIIPSWFVKESLKLAPSIEMTLLEGEANARSYGLQWWLNKDLKKEKGKRAYPDAPDDLFLSLGHHGQTLAVVPSLKLIMVRTSSDKEAPIDRKLMIKYLMESIEGAK